MSKKSRKKKQQIRTIEHHLRSYHDYKTGIKNLKRKLDMLLPNVTATYELAEGTTGTFKVHSTTEKAALDRIESRQAIQTNETIELYQMIVDTIDTALRDLSDIERQFVKLRYFEKETIGDVCEKLHMSDRQAHRLRFHIMNHFLISLSNIKDLKI